MLHMNKNTRPKVAILAAVAVVFGGVWGAVRQEHGALADTNVTAAGAAGNAAASPVSANTTAATSSSSRTQAKATATATATAAAARVQTNTRTRAS